uniref:(northern house mosquito) hypothetical protein n=1 Tax=Culex pipiens TaxID=7175 RepID=A0A8D8H4N9_CULPI
MIFLGARFDRLGSRRRNLAETGRVKHRKQFANTPWNRAVYHATSFLSGYLGGLGRQSRFRREEGRAVKVEPVLQQMVVLVDGGQRDADRRRGRFPLQGHVLLVDRLGRG